MYATLQQSFTPSDSVSTWYSDKAVDGFTIHTSANLTSGVDWVVVHDYRISAKVEASKGDLHIAPTTLLSTV